MKNRHHWADLCDKSYNIYTETQMVQAFSGKRFRLRFQSHWNSKFDYWYVHKPKESERAGISVMWKRNAGSKLSENREEPVEHIGCESGIFSRAFYFRQGVFPLVRLAARLVVLKIDRILINWGRGMELLVILLAENGTLAIACMT